MLNRGTARADSVKRTYKFSSGEMYTDRMNWIEFPIHDAITSKLYPISWPYPGAMPLYTVYRIRRIKEEPQFIRVVYTCELYVNMSLHNCMH